jgi:guanine nucleotide-binding protein G(i) subunit alpha
MQVLLNISHQSDILKARQRTTAVSEFLFFCEKRQVKFYDVGGSKTQRLYWTPYFEQVDAIVFITSAASYDQMLYECPEENRLSDALELFRTIVNHKMLTKCNIIVLLNKMDLLDKKFRVSPIQKYFPDYQLQNPTVKEVASYFKKKFLSVILNTDRKIYSHYSTGTDTKTMKFIFTAIL